jgi:hypothetical protein
MRQLEQASVSGLDYDTLMAAPDNLAFKGLPIGQYDALGYAWGGKQQRCYESSSNVSCGFQYTQGHASYNSTACHKTEACIRLGVGAGKRLRGFA